MDIVQQYAALSDSIQELGQQADALRQDLHRPGAQLHSTQYEVVARRQTDRVLRIDLLPPEILNDPRFWTVASHQAVDVRPVSRTPAFLRSAPLVPVDLLRYRC